MNIIDEKIICLAKSIKNGGRCIIGKNLQHEWIRPVSSPKGGELYDVNIISILDLLFFPQLEYTPLFASKRKLSLRRF